jgi:tRNA G18 (ribose-2'-O)-methylase SpoU
MKKISMDNLGRISVDEFRNSDKTPLVVVLDNIRSQHNIGSVFRTSDAFRIEQILLCGISATPPSREIQKTALGSTESVEWKYFQTTIEAIRKLKNENYTVLSVEQVEGSISLKDFIPEKNKKYALVFGNEVNGVSQDVIDNSDFCIEIPQFGTKHSFNISVTAGIVMYDLFHKL